MSELIENDSLSDEYDEFDPIESVFSSFSRSPRSICSFNIDIEDRRPTPSSHKSDSVI